MPPRAPLREMLTADVHVAFADSEEQETSALLRSRSCDATHHLLLFVRDLRSFLAFRRGVCTVLPFDSNRGVLKRRPRSIWLGTTYCVPKPNLHKANQPRCVFPLSRRALSGWLGMSSS